MTYLNQAELLAMRACIEVAEPSVDDAGPMEIWARAMDAIKKLENMMLPEVNLITGTTPEASILHPDSNLHTCTCVIAAHKNADGDELCGFTAIAKYEDGINEPEYFCQHHYDVVSRTMADPDTDCGWTILND